MIRTFVLLVAVGLALPGAAGAADPLRPQQWNLDLVEADAARATSTGAGAVVAVIDSGVAAAHPDLAGIDWARTNGADVINLSLGSEVPIAGAAGGDAVDAAIRRALSEGVVVVAAAGNSGMPVCEQPAASAGLLCVGAVDKRRERSVFSSFGSGLGVVAPGGSALPVAGEDVLSTYPPDGYRELAGTSQAAPHVAGVAALLVSLGVRGREAVDRLLATATDLGASGVDPVYGHGLVNARTAVAGLAARPGSPAAGGPRPFVRVRRRQRASRAVRVRLRAAVVGRVRIRVRARRRTVATANRRVRAGRARTVVARLRPRARRAAPFHARVRVRLPGETRVRVRPVRIY